MTSEERRQQLFPKLSDDELRCLMPHGIEQVLTPGEILFQQGDAEDGFYVVLSGALRVTRQLAGEDTLLALHEERQFTGALSMFTHETSIATGYAVGPTTVLWIKSEGFQSVMRACPAIASGILSVMAMRRPEADAMAQQREKMAALGKLSAGLAHELNNPAAAARRAAARLRDSLVTLQRSAFELGERQLTDAQKEMLLAVQTRAARPALDSLAMSDREDSLTDWLEDREVPQSCSLAAPLAAGGFTSESLENLASEIPDSAAFSEAISWLGSSLEAVELLNTVEECADRISNLVGAIKDYSYMDQAPQQEVNVQQTLETTLSILRFKWKHGVEIVRDYAPNLPCITAYGSELNQVWTNLIDNSLDALDGKGHLFLKTACAGDRILVEIGDDGPGVPKEIQNRVFEPFFTTKGIGKGTGLGLDTAYRIVVARHHGDIRLLSEPGKTRFQVYLPVSQPKER